MRTAPIALLLLATTVAACAGRKLPPPQWTLVDRARAAGITRLAVVAGRYDGSVAPCMITTTKALVQALRSTGRLTVRGYRDVMIALRRPDVDVAAESGVLDEGLARRLAEKLKVDGVVVVWMSRCGQFTGEALSVAMFATASGVRVGGYATARAGMPGELGSYSMVLNAERMAAETAAALTAALTNGGP